MKYLTLISFLFALLLTPFSTQAQLPTCELSAAIPDMPLIGWNKVLQMRNGNTVMIHLEPRKGIIVKVFDKDRKLIASRKHICELFDINALEHTMFKGFYDIGGNAVLFMQQPYNNHLTLFRLSFSATDAGMIHEEPMVQSPGLSNPTYCDVEQIKAIDGYAVLMLKDLIHHPEEKITLGVWNSDHKLLKTAALDVSSADLSAIRCMQVKAEGKDLYTSFRIVTQDKRGQYRQFVLFARLPEQDTVFKSQLMEMPKEGQVVYTLMSYDGFAQKENLYITMLGITAHENSFKTTSYETTLLPYLGVFEPGNMLAERIVPVSCTKLRDTLKNYKNYKRLLLDTADWRPVKMHTTINGVTMVVYEQMATGYTFAKGKYEYKTFLGNIGVSLLKDDGTELFACMMPKKQDLNCYYFQPGTAIASRNENRYLFDQWPVNAFNSQFASFDMVPQKYSTYILYNDNKRNFDTPPGERLEGIDNYDYGNAVCYILNRKKELSKTELFGAVATDEYKSCMLESADYDNATGIYATLMLHRQGNKVETKLAWIHFNP